MYSRTQNENGTLNTRCLDCFMTIASCVESEPEMEWIEACHLCPERVLSELFRRGVAQEGQSAMKRAVNF